MVASDVSNKFPSKYAVSVNFKLAFLEELNNKFPVSFL